MAGGRYRDLLKFPGFQPFLWAQFLGALNDNSYKIVISLFALSTQPGISALSNQLSVVGMVFILPFFLFSGYAGYLADIYSKRNVLIATKIFEILAMATGILVLFQGQFGFMLIVLFLMALHSTFFSPAKYGILPEMLPDKDLSRANGLLEMTTLLAIVLGSVLATFMFDLWRERLWIIGFILTGTAVVGTVAALGIPRVPPAGAVKAFSRNPFGEVWTGVQRLYGDRTLWLTVLGISYFWFLGSLLQMDIWLLGREVMKLDEFKNGLLATFLAAGIGVGSLIAGRLSGDKVELGLVPLGSIGLGLCSLLLYSSTHSYFQTGIALSLLGFSGGLFIVPLNALLQQRSGHEEKGQLIATNNFLNTGGILLASVLFPFSRTFSGSRRIPSLLYSESSLSAQRCTL
jgi:acyl-[acyl-carrier-protein]-phospholipid O-acyltransferase/long-chain-fatty-acid--[acyl-carrier-protein] ligase